MKDHIVKIERGFDVLPAGEYAARVNNIRWQDGQFGAQMRFQFGILDSNYGGRTVVDWCAATFTPATKLYAWAAAALAPWQIPDHWDFDNTMLLGKIVQLEVAVERGSNGEYNIVKEVRPEH
jgi:hypothetical protein